MFLKKNSLFFLFIVSFGLLSSVSFVLGSENRAEHINRSDVKKLFKEGIKINEENEDQDIPDLVEQKKEETKNNVNEDKVNRKKNERVLPKAEKVGGPRQIFINYLENMKNDPLAYQKANLGLAAGLEKGMASAMAKEMANGIFGQHKQDARHEVEALAAAQKERLRHPGALVADIAVKSFVQGTVHFGASKVVGFWDWAWNTVSYLLHGNSQEKLVESVKYAKSIANSDSEEEFHIQKPRLINALDGVKKLYSPEEVGAFKAILSMVENVKNEKGEAADPVLNSWLKEKYLKLVKKEILSQGYENHRKSFKLKMEHQKK